MVHPSLQSGMAFIPSSPQNVKNGSRGLHSHIQQGRVRNSLMAVEPASLVPGGNVFIASAVNEQSQQLQQLSQMQDGSMQSIQQLSPTTTLVVFIIGIIPFIWATYEFWRRIAFGEPFGTGADSVIIPSPLGENEDKNIISIGEDGNPVSSRGRRTLDRGALLVAYVLFGVAAFVVAIAVASVVMGPQNEMPL